MGRDFLKKVPPQTSPQKLLLEKWTAAHKCSSPFLTIGVSYQTVLRMFLFSQYVFRHLQ